MIRFNAAPAFDFDEWTALHARDPDAFEARRRALLAIEIARGGDRGDMLHKTLDELDTALAGLGALERAAASHRAMATSARELSRRLAALARVLRQAAADAPGRPSA